MLLVAHGAKALVREHEPEPEVPLQAGCVVEATSRNVPNFDSTATMRHSTSTLCTPHYRSHVVGAESRSTVRSSEIVRRPLLGNASVKFDDKAKSFLLASRRVRPSAYG